MAILSVFSERLLCCGSSRASVEQILEHLVYKLLFPVDILNGFSGCSRESFKTTPRTLGVYAAILSVFSERLLFCGCSRAY